MRKPTPAPAALPDVRDGLTRIERIVLFELDRAAKELGRRDVPTALLYGRVVEHINISVAELQATLGRLTGRGKIPRLMLIKEDFVDLATPTGPMRTHRYQPTAGGPYPGVALFSEIFQLTGPIARTARILAAQGYIVAAPEVYHELEAPGVALAYDKEGTDKGNRYKIEKEVAAYDADARAVIAHLRGLPHCSGQLGSFGVCLGGCLSFRCAMNPEIAAAACFYATDIHKRSLGKGMADDSLDRVPEIKGELLMVWGKQDPHIPQEGRDLVHRTLTAAGANYTIHEFNASHAFMRDEGPRYNPALAQIGYALVFELFARRLQLRNAELPPPPAK